MKKVVITFILVFCSMSVLAEEIKPFTSDGCSAFPDGNFDNKELWLDCCIAHDFAYWQGGTFGERRKADEALNQCVSELGEGATGTLMYLGVRVGGSPYWPTSFRWGYGWPYPRGYKALTDKEKLHIKQVIENSMPVK